MVNLAAGARGINYYIFAGGPNPAGMGTMADVYDYAAPIAADGTPRRTYEALKAFGRFVQDNPRLILAERLFSVRFAYEWQHFAGCAAIDEAFFRHGLRYSLMQSAYQPGYLALTGPIAGPEPVVLSGIISMSAAMQRHLADYVLGGGGLLVAPDFPRVDLEGKPCTVLAAAVKAPLSEECRVDTVVEPLMRSGERRLYNMTPVRVFPELPPAARACLTDAGGGRIYGCSWAAGKGRVVQVGATWQAVGFAQSDFAAGIVRELGARPLGKSSQRNLFHVDYRLEDGRTGVFALNLRASPVSAEITLPDGEELMFDLGAMEVGYKESALKEPGGNIGKTDPCHFR